MNAKKLGATLFPISGLEGQTFRLRVLRVRDPIPMDTQTPVRLNRWATQLWKEIKQAVMPTSRFEWPAFLTPDVESLTVGRILTVQTCPTGSIPSRSLIKLSKLFPHRLEQKNSNLPERC